jgi:serine/threonine protein kinase
MQRGGGSDVSSDKNVAALANLTPGTVFARDFRVVRPLREGGMGAVYVAEQISTGRRRALKLMSPDLVGNPEVRERFVREAKVAANIESDHVVETVTAGVDEATGAPYLVMELLRGEELADAAERTGPLPLEDLKEIFTQIGHALEQAHAQGIVHRDLKPENVFLAISKRRDVAFTAKVLDFGIAKLVADGIQKTGTQPLGSPLFMAPEQTDRKGRVCPATDVWALGLMAFFLLTGKSYWLEADGGSLAGLLREICVDPLVSASDRAVELGVGDKLPSGFDAWFSRCVVRDVDARFQEAGAAVHAFSELDAPNGSKERRLKLQTGLFEDGGDGRHGVAPRRGGAHDSHTRLEGDDRSRGCLDAHQRADVPQVPLGCGRRDRGARRVRRWGLRLASAVALRGHADRRDLGFERAIRDHFCRPVCPSAGALRLPARDD